MSALRRPLPASLRIAAHVTSRPTFAWLCFLVALAAAPFVFSSSLGLQLASQICIAIVACLSFNLLLGQGGMLSFGHAVYTGLGAYGAIHLLNALSAGRFHMPVSLVPLIGGFSGLLASVVLGFLTTRRAGTTFAMITLGLGELVFALASMMTGFFGGEGGVSGNRIVGPAVHGVTFGPQKELYFLLAGWCLVSSLAMFGFTRTPLGLSLNAVRDNPERASFIGLSTTRIRFRSFMIAGFFAGIAGGMSALNFEIVTPDAVSPIKSANYLLFTLLGGSTMFGGPIVGAVLLVLCSALLPSLTQGWLLYLGVAFMAMMIVEPGGVAALARRWWRTGARRMQHGSSQAPEPRGAALAVVRALCIFVALMAASALIEMSYRLRFGSGSASGLTLSFFGVPLDAGSAGAWSGALLVVLIAAALARAATIMTRRGPTRRASIRPTPPRRGRSGRSGRSGSAGSAGSAGGAGQ